MRYRLGCSLSYEIGSDCTFIFNLEAAKTARQAILNEALVFTPPVEPRVFADPSTDNRYVMVNVVPGGLSLEYNADVELSAQRADPATISETPIGELPLEVFPYLLPSRYVPSDRLASFAQAEFGSLAPGNKRVSEICSWIYDHLQYQPGATNEETTADETLLRRAGVCRDFSHLGIAFCRGRGIPARFMSCYAYGLVPPDFQAVFEA